MIKRSTQKRKENTMNEGGDGKLQMKLAGRRNEMSRKKMDLRQV